MPTDEEKIDEIVGDGVVKFAEKTFLKKVLTFFVKHGVHINTLLIVSLIIITVWYGRPIYDRFNKLPSKIETAQEINEKQDSVVGVLTRRIERLNREYAEKFKALDDNIHLLIKYRNADTQVLNDLISKNSEVTRRILHREATSIPIPDTILLQNTNENDTCQ